MGWKSTGDFAAGKTLGALPRFQALGSAVTIALAKPTVQLLVASSGQQSVQPTQTTDYKLTATGPGGVVTNDTTVNVNSNLQSSLSVQPAELHYHKVGEHVEEQGSATLTWSAPGVSNASLDHFGSVSPSGTRNVQPSPTKTEEGPVDETITYTLRTSNACGGSDTKTVSVHMVGSIEMAQAAVSETTLVAELTLNSIYFPYDQPTRANPQGGLVPSEEKRALGVANAFGQYL